MRQDDSTVRKAEMGREDFLSQLRRVNTERYEAWVGEEPLMMCEHCGRAISDARQAGSTHCNAPFDAQQHSFTKPHPYLKTSGDAGIMFDALELGGEVGELLNIVKKLEREERGWRGSRADPAAFADECADVLICLDKLARRRNVDLAAVTVAKFNATSNKVGLPQKLATLESSPADGDTGAREIARLRQALTDVTDPLGKIQRDAEAQGSILSGMAYSIANSISFVQGIATAALTPTDTGEQGK